MRAAALLATLAACSSASATLEPVIDTPADPASPGYPWTDLTSVTIEVAHAGSATNLATKSFARGQAPELPDVPFADDLVVHLSGLRGQGEVAYGRSCAVSARPDTALLSPHLYFARIARWAAGASPSSPGRTGGAAYTAPDGSAVILGGDGETALDRFVTFDGRFEPIGAATAARKGAVVAALADGSAFVIGGTDAAGPVAFFELVALPPAATPVQRLDDSRARLVDPAAATLVDGTVVVIGGRAPKPDGSLEATGKTWIFRVGDADAPAPPQLLAAVLATPRGQHTATRLGDEVGADVLVVGGLDATGQPVATAELYEPLAEAYADFHPAMVQPRYDHRAARLPDGSILIVGGRSRGGATEASIELYQPRVGQFVTAATLPANAGVTEMTLTPLPDGRVLIAGGRDANGVAVATTNIARLDPIDGKVDLQQTDPLGAPRAGHEAALLCDGTILVVGGAAAGSERYNPPAVGRR